MGVFTILFITGHQKNVLWGEKVITTNGGESGGSTSRQSVTLCHQIPSSPLVRPLHVEKINIDMRQHNAIEYVKVTPQLFVSQIQKCVSAAERREERIVGIGSYYFLSTQHGDGWLLQKDQPNALPLCIDGKAIQYEYDVVEQISDIRFTVEFTGTYRFGRNGFRYYDVDGWNDFRQLSPDMAHTLKQECTQR